MNKLNLSDPLSHIGKDLDASIGSARALIARSPF
jgi:hypothetical protein